MGLNVGLSTEFKFFFDSNKLRRKEKPLLTSDRRWFVYLGASICGIILDE